MILLVNTMFLELDSYPRLCAPFGMVVCGPTMSGKSEFVFKLIREKEQLIDKPIDRVVYLYGEWQAGFEGLKDVEFHKGIDSVVSDATFFDSSQLTVLILDDLGQELSGHPKAAQLFTQGIHHKNICVIFIIQNLYKQGKAMRDIHLNCQYLVLFRNCRDVNQIKVLGRQMGMSHLSEVYEKVTSEAYQPLVIDMRPNTPNYLRLRSHIFPSDLTRIYVKDSLPCPKTLGN